MTFSDNRERIELCFRKHDLDDYLNQLNKYYQEGFQIEWKHVDYLHAGKIDALITISRPDYPIQMPEIQLKNKVIKS